MSTDVSTELFEVRCPSDGGGLSADFVCSTCAHAFPVAEVRGRRIRDLRLRDRPTTARLEIEIPVSPLPDDLRKRFFRYRDWPGTLASNAALRSRYGTKLSVGFHHHIADVQARLGRHLRVLDLGCGSGANKRYLGDLGITRVVGVDWWGPGADYLADAHRLPFAGEQFDLVLSTAVLEHCYLPHLVMREIHRVLAPQGSGLLGASFWESWHGESFFHFTPNGLYALCRQAGLDLVDLWSGWGFIPAVLSHAVSFRLKKPGYALQRIWDRAARLFFDEPTAYQRRVGTSGSLFFRVDKPVPSK